MIYESVSEATSVWIKGEDFNLSSLCDNLWSAEQLDGCSLVISRYGSRPSVCDNFTRAASQRSWLQPVPLLCVIKHRVLKLTLSNLQACATGLPQVSCAM